MENTANFAPMYSLSREAEIWLGFKSVISRKHSELFAVVVLRTPLDSLPFLSLVAV